MVTTCAPHTVFLIRPPRNRSCGSGADHGGSQMEFHKDRRRALRRHHKARMAARYAEAMRHGMWGYGSLRPEPVPRIVFWTDRNGVEHSHDARRRWFDDAGIAHHYVTWDEIFSERRKVASRIADHARVCTCGVCGNPRYMRAELTLQERAQIQEEMQDLVLETLVPDAA